MSNSLAHCKKDHGGGGRDVSELAETDFLFTTTPSSSVFYLHVTEKVHCITLGADSMHSFFLLGYCVCSAQLDAKNMVEVAVRKVSPNNMYALSNKQRRGYE